MFFFAVLATLAVLHAGAHTLQKRQVVAEKPGSCPALPPGTVGTCVELCSGDGSCPGAQKCCSNGCGHVCKDPVRDCSAVSCLRPACLRGFELFTPEGACCPRCRRVRRCPYGSSGTCGTIAGLSCEEGSTCVLDDDYPDAGGVCCINKPIFDCGLVLCALPECDQSLWVLPIGECCPRCPVTSVP